MSNKRKSYTANLKLKIVNYAEVHGNRNSGRKFGVDEKSIREWRKIKDKLENLPRNKRACRGNSARWPTLETNLVN